MNTQFVDSLVQVILALSPDERSLLEEKLFGNIPYASALELAHLVNPFTDFGTLCNLQPEITRTFWSSLKKDVLIASLFSSAPSAPQRLNKRCDRATYNPKSTATR
ncbi:MULTISPECIES: hypothetical protein [Cyanophyceae]|uniref:hypothetical protein n=1 Tax=Cyanophyceae TaxID=3028117 RepID=UPI001686609F|nr:hypothetical protein [Trichocoleus sp. FACHB-40]MBD2004853.1 hypothetical protein [Trichocoleus sp. FACHB-40]